MNQMQQWEPQAPVQNNAGLEALIMAPANHARLRLIAPDVDPQQLVPRLQMSIMGSPRPDKIWECSQGSLLLCALGIVENNLTVGGGPFAQAYIVPYGGDAQLQMSYRGLRDIAFSTGMFTQITGEAVFENDLFEHWKGIETHLKHQPAMRNRGALIGAWSLARHIDGTISTQHVTIEDIDAFHGAATGDSPAWNKWKPRMGLKGCIKRHMGQLILDPTKTERLRAVIILDNKGYDPSRGAIATPERRLLVEPPQPGAIIDAPPAADAAAEPPDPLEAQIAQAEAGALRNGQGYIRMTKNGHLWAADSPENLRRGLSEGWAAIFEELEPVPVVEGPASGASTIEDARANLGPREPAQATISTPPKPQAQKMPKGARQDKLTAPQLIKIRAAAKAADVTDAALEEEMVTGGPLEAAVVPPGSTSHLLFDEMLEGIEAIVTRRAEAKSKLEGKVKR